MASKQFKTYCRIIDYVDAVDPELSKIIRGLCVDMSLGSLKGKPGITFLMPQDKAFRAKLEKLAYSDKIEDSNKANDMLNALIFRDVFKSPSDWMAKKDDIPNSLLPSQHVEIESTTANGVIFKSGAKAVIDTDFKDASRRGNLAVWKLESGEIPVTTDKPSSFKYAKSGKAKTGGYNPGNLASQSERFNIAIAVENAYALCQLQQDTGASGHKRRDVYLEHTMSLVNYILHVRNDKALLLDKVLPLVSLDKIDFYLLVEPHRASGNYILDDMLIHEWWVNRHNHPCSIAKVVQELEELLDAGDQALIYSNRAQVFEKIAEVRDKLSKYVDARPRGIVDEISKAYDELNNNNTINGLGPIYPQGLAAYYASEPGLKMLHDELRYLTYGAFKQFESHRFDIGAFNELVNMIGECLYAGTADERARSQKLLNKTSIKYLISPTEKVQEIKIFLYSTMFMYVPMTSADANNLKQKNSVSRPDPNNIVIFNIAKDLYTQHKRIIDDTDASNLDIVAALRTLNVDSLDPVLRDELKKKFQ